MPKVGMIIKERPADKGNAGINIRSAKIYTFAQNPCDEKVIRFTCDSGSGVAYGGRLYAER